MQELDDIDAVKSSINNHITLTHLTEDMTTSVRMRTLLEMDKYFRNYELYSEYEEYRDRNHQAIEEAWEKIQRIRRAIPEDKEINEFHNSIQQVESTHRILEHTFAQYDFTQKRYEEMVADYQIESYLFLKENVLLQLQDRFSEAIPDDPRELKRIAKYVGEKMWDFFAQNFYQLKGLQNSYVKAMTAVFESIDKGLVLPNEEC